METKSKFCLKLKLKFFHLRVSEETAIEQPQNKTMWNWQTSWQRLSSQVYQTKL